MITKDGKLRSPVGFEHYIDDEGKERFILHYECEEGEEHCDGLFPKPLRRLKVALGKTKDGRAMITKDGNTRFEGRAMISKDGNTRFKGREVALGEYDKTYEHRTYGKSRYEVEMVMKDGEFKR